MTTIGTVESIWRYPVKSMRGEETTQAFVGFSGVFGDRCYAFGDSAARKGFPYLTARVQQQILRYQPHFRHSERALMPPNLSEAVNLGPGITPANGDAQDLLLDVVTPTGAVVAIDSAELIQMLGEGLRDEHHLTLLRSDRALTDCRPVSMTSVQTVRQVAEEVGTSLDKRQFRANLFLDLASNTGFAEDELVGRKLRIGAKAEMTVLERDPRCMMISLDPDTGEHNPEVLRKVATAYANYAGVYCAVLVEGLVTKGDSIELL